MRVVRLQPSAQHTWHQLSVCLSICVFSASPIAAQLVPVRFSSNRSEKKLTLPMCQLSQQDLGFVHLCISCSIESSDQHIASV
jgi:hypothetical protein